MRQHEQVGIRYLLMYAPVKSIRKCKKLNYQKKTDKTADIHVRVESAYTLCRGSLGFHAKLGKTVAVNVHCSSVWTFSCTHQYC